MARLLQDWVRQQAQHRGEAVAVVLQGERLSYGALEALSNRLAQALRAQGCRRGDRVCLLMPKSPLAIACLLGIYKADCIYVPLDPGSPASRLAKITASCEPRLLLAAGPVTETVRQLQRLTRGLQVGWLGALTEAADAAFQLSDVMAMPPTAPPTANRSDDPAHILYTSGSTGTPKGVVITHANVGAFVGWAVHHFGLDESDRLSGHPPLSFDLSVFDIFGSFAAGAELHLVPAECNLLPQRLAQWMREAAVTQWFSVPAVLNFMAKFDAVRALDFPELRRVLWCGEVLPTASLLHWMRRLPHVSFTNLYGPTEATIASSHHTVDCYPEDEGAAIPIGTACGGEGLLVLDRELSQTAPGETGDLYIKGVGLSPGYWRDPAATARAFLLRRREDGTDERLYRTGDLARLGHDGLVYFVGREDSQIKSRGYRIELGEIETALSRVESLRESAVVAVPGESFEGYMVCCAYVPKNASGITPAHLRSELSRLLPEYMIPSKWQALDELPKNSAGKVDRRRLKEAWSAHGTPAAR